MLTEGIGIVAPQKVRITLTSAEQRVLFDAAKERASYRQYASRNDRWGRGISGTKRIAGLGELSQQERPIFAGLLGEYAAQRYINGRFSGRCSIDIELRESGDFGVDLQPFGMKIDVKTRESEFGPNRVRRTNNSGAMLRLAPHIFLFAQWVESSSVYLLGWQWTNYLADKPLVKSAGAWMNVVLDDIELRPMCSLRSELSAWEAARQWR